LDRLSGLPLALTQAAAYIGQTTVSIVQYLEYYDSMWKDLMEQQDEYPPHEYAQRSVLTTWRISYEQVKSQSNEASKLVQLWSFLYAGDLWYELVSCPKKLGEDTVVPDWLTVLAQHRLKFDHALALLIKYSLVEGKTETASYAMHSVLHSWCRYLGTSEAERCSFQRLAIQIVGCMVPDQSTREYWVLQRRLLPHGQAIFDSTKLRTQAKMNTTEARAYNNLAGMFAVDNRYLEAEAMYERALAGKEKALGPTHTSTLDIVNNLGVLYYNQGRLVDAEAMYERALAGHKKALGPKHPSTLKTANLLAYLHHCQAASQKRKRSTGEELAMPLLLWVITVSLLAWACTAACPASG
jgi:tetratricopeptide (TPR) repeat protein